MTVDRALRRKYRRGSEIRDAALVLVGSFIDVVLGW